MKKSDNPYPLALVRADLFIVRQIMAALDEKDKVNKPLRGQAAYHIQQATEKLIKYQMYEACDALDPYRMYVHEIEKLLVYADSLELEIYVPEEIRKNSIRITRWEAQGRYDLSMVVRRDTIEKFYTICTEWLCTMDKRH